MKRLILLLVCFAYMLPAQLTNFAPTNMTTDSAPSPLVVTESSSFEGGYLAFNGESGNGWIGQTGGTAFIQINFGSGNTHTLLAYSFATTSDYVRAPTAWTLQGSNDGSTYTTLDTESVTSNAANGGAVVRYFICPSCTTAYQYFKFNFTAGSDGTYMQINQISLYSGSYVAPTLTSGVFSPTNMTSYNSNFPMWVDATGAFAGNDEAYELFNTANGGGPSGIWVLNGTSGWVFLDTMYPTGETLASYTVTSSNANLPRTPMTWTLQGSNDNQTWTTVDTRTSETAWSASETRSYSVVGAAAYRSFRFNFTANNGDGSYSQFANISLSVSGGTSGYVANPSVISIGP
jgi:hypothetical protein